MADENPFAFEREESRAAEDAAPAIDDRPHPSEYEDEPEVDESAEHPDCELCEHGIYRWDRPTGNDRSPFREPIPQPCGCPAGQFQHEVIARTLEANGS